MPLVLEKKFLEKILNSQKNICLLVLEKKMPKNYCLLCRKKIQKSLSFGPCGQNLKNLCFWSLRKECPKTIVFCSWKNVKNIWSSRKKSSKIFVFWSLGKKNSQKSLFSVPKKQNSKIFVFWSLRKKSLLVFK